MCSSLFEPFASGGAPECVRRVAGDIPDLRRVAACISQDAERGPFCSHDTRAPSPMRCRASPRPRAAYGTRRCACSPLSAPGTDQFLPEFIRRIHDAKKLAATNWAYGRVPQDFLTALWTLVALSGLVFKVPPRSGDGEPSPAAATGPRSARARARPRPRTPGLARRCPGDDG